MDFIIGLIVSLVVLLFSAILHEVAHGFVADRLGDPTARLMGRLTLNPIKHIDPFMSIVLPIMLVFSSFYLGSHVIFGGAKPVPVDPFNLKEGKKDMALVSLAGPLTNLLLTVIATIITKLLFPNYSYNIFLNDSILLHPITYLLFLIIIINLSLAIFNLLPIPPLDGSKVFALLLPDREAAAYLSLGTVGILILFALLSFPIGGFYLPNVINQLFQFALNLLRL